MPKKTRSSSAQQPDLFAETGADGTAEVSVATVGSDASASSAARKKSAAAVRPASPISASQQVLASTPLAKRFDDLPAGWRLCLDDFIASSTYSKLCAFVDDERAQGKTIYPAEPFRALTLTPAEKVKVVILGQDPYHGEDRGIPQAHGLAFSVPAGVRPPPSLRNICKEISAEFGLPPPEHGCLDHWAKQGVLLLNTVLTVERDKAASHAKHGWEACTDALIAHLAEQQQGLVFLLWGAHAQAKRALLARHQHHLVLEAPHPSPLSAHRGFLGCGHFTQANSFLEDSNRTPIDWRIPPLDAA